MGTILAQPEHAQGILAREQAAGPKSGLLLMSPDRRSVVLPCLKRRKIA
jgi:hypothetical protein